MADSAVDAVYISTTNEKHKAQTLAAAAAGKHLLCEKPLALSLKDAIEMIEACRAAGVVIGTNHHLRNANTEGAYYKASAPFHIHVPHSALCWLDKDRAKHPHIKRITGKKQ